ncbi:MAG: 50S ribosomal protein L29, partial [Anaerolineales bacterium]
MKIKEIRTLPDDEIAAEIEKARAKVFKMRFQGKSESVENPGSLKKLR